MGRCTWLQDFIFLTGKIIQNLYLFFLAASCSSKTFESVTTYLLYHHNMTCAVIEEIQRSGHFVLHQPAGSPVDPKPEVWLSFVGFCQACSSVLSTA